MPSVLHLDAEAASRELQDSDARESGFGGTRKLTESYWLAATRTRKACRASRRVATRNVRGIPMSSTVHRPTAARTLRPRWTVPIARPLRCTLLLMLVVSVAGPLIAQEATGTGADRNASDSFMIHGAVVDPAGDPVPGARVELQAPRTAQERAAMLRGADAPASVDTDRTDANGEFSLRATGPDFWRIAIEAPGFAAGFWNPLPNPVAEETALLPFVLRATRTVTARLLDSDGAPVPGTFLLVQGQNRTRPSRPGQSSIQIGDAEQLLQTDADGRVRAQVAADTAVRIVALPASAVPILKRVDADETTTTLTTQTGQLLRLRMVSPSGEPLENVVLFANRRLIGTSGADGVLDLRMPADVERSKLRLGFSGPDGKLTLQTSAADLEPGADGVATAALEPTPVLRGRVTDTNGRPLVGATVWTSPLERTRTDAEGTFALVSEQDARPLLQALAPDHFRGVQRLLPSHFASGKAPSLVLEPAVHVVGRITSASGNVSGASIRWTPKDLLSLQGRGEDAMSSRARSRRDGRFRLGPLPPGAGFELVAEHPEFARASRDVAAIAAGQSRTVDLEMSAGTLTFGTVVDESDVPVVGAEIEMTESTKGSNDMMALISRQMGLGNAAQTALSEGDGTFRFPNLRPGNYDLAIRADGFAPAKVPAVNVPDIAAPTNADDAAPRAAFEIGTITLAPGATLEGEVRAKGGRRLSEARIVVREATGMGMMIGAITGEPPEPDAVSGSGGSFAVDSLSPDATYRVDIERDGYQGVTLAAVKPAGDPLEIELEPASTLAGTVKNELGEDLSGARVTLQQQFGSVQGGMMNFNPRRMVKRATTDEDGAFEVEGIGTGTWDLVATSEGYIDLERKGIEVQGGKEIDDVELRLLRGGTLRGRVISSNGDPVVGANLTRVVQQRSMIDISRANRRTARSDGDGNFVLDGLPLGATSFSAQHEKHQEKVLDLEIQSGDNRLDFILERGLTISGRVLDPTGLPVGGATVSATTPGGGMMVMVGGGAGPKTAVTNSDGEYLLEGYGAGTYEVTAKLEGYAPATTDAPIQLDRSDATSVDLQLQTGAAITGIVDGLSFDELSQVQIMAMQPGASTMPLMAQVDYEGSYLIDNVPAGDWMVMATVGQGGKNARETVTIDPGTLEMVVDFSFGGGLTLTGRVERNGEPVSGTMVIASSTDGPGAGQTTTDPDGRYTLEGLEAGRYQILVTSLNRSSHQETIELVGDQELNIILREATVRGRVVRADTGEGLEGVDLTLNRTDDDSPLAGMAVFGMGGPRSGVAGAFVLDGVSAGAYRLTATLDGWGTESVDFVVEDDDINGVELSLERAARLSVYVIRANGSIPTRVGVTVVDDQDQMLLQQTRTLAEEGRLDFHDLPDGTWTLLVAESGSPTARQPIVVPGDPVTVALPMGGGIRLFVPELQQSGASAQVKLRYPDGRPYRAAGLEGMFGRSFAVVIDGRSQVNAIPVGIWTVVVETLDGEWSKEATVRVIENQVIEYTID